MRVVAGFIRDNFVRSISRSTFVVLSSSLTYTIIPGDRNYYYCRQPHCVGKVKTLENDSLIDRAGDNFKGRGKNCRVRNER